VGLLDTIIRTYAPPSVRSFVGLGAGEGIYDEALSGYIAEMGDYVQTGDEEELGDYVQTGAYEELGDQSQGDEEELGDYMETGAYEELGATVAAHAGARRVTQMQPAGRFLAQVPSRKMLAAVPNRSMAEEVPRWTAKRDRTGLYSGIFSGGMH
jgi:hypothetical protein